MKKSKKFWQRYQCDIIAMLIFSVFSCFTTLLYEVAAAGISVEQWLGIKIIYIPLRFAGAYILGSLIDKVRLKLARDNRFIHKALADAISLSIYQIPIYLLSAAVMRVSWQPILITVALYILDNILFGWLYGYLLNQVRKYFLKSIKQADI